jgi:hypothetical protein
MIMVLVALASRGGILLMSCVKMTYKEYQYRILGKG